MLLVAKDGLDGTTKVVIPITVDGMLGCVSLIDPPSSYKLDYTDEDKNWWIIKTGIFERITINGDQVEKLKNGQLITVGRYGMTVIPITVPVSPSEGGLTGPDISAVRGYVLKHAPELAKQIIEDTNLYKNTSELTLYDIAHIACRATAAVYLQAESAIQQALKDTYGK